MLLLSVAKIFFLFFLTFLIGHIGAKMRYSLDTLIVANQLLGMGLWRPAGTNPEWNNYPLQSGLSNSQIWDSLHLQSKHTKDGIVKVDGEYLPTKLENMDKRGCVIDGFFCLKNSLGIKVNEVHFGSEFKLGKSLRFNGNEAVDLSTGTETFIKTLIQDLHEAPVALHWVTLSNYRTKSISGVKYNLWSLSLTRFLELISNGIIVPPPHSRPMGSYFYNVVTQKIEEVTADTKQSVFFLKKSTRKYTRKIRGKKQKMIIDGKVRWRKPIEGEEEVEQTYFSLRVKPSAIMSAVKRDSWYTSKRDGERYQNIDRTKTHKQTRDWLQQNGVMVCTPLCVVHNHKGKTLVSPLKDQKKRLLRDLGGLRF